MLMLTVVLKLTLIWPCREEKGNPIRAFFRVLTSSPLSSPCVALMSHSSPLFSTLYPTQSQLWCMHEGGFPEDQRGHYPGAIRPLVEHVNECRVLLCFHMQPLYHVGRIEGDSLGMIKHSLKCIYFITNISILIRSPLFSVSCCNLHYSGYFLTVACEEVRSLIGAVVLSCRLRARGVSHHQSGWNALTFEHEIPRVPCGPTSLVCILQ